MSDIKVINLGEQAKTHKPVLLPTKYFNKHTAVMGMTGSGKTGLIVGIIEQAIQAKIPAILVDIKGDLANILNQEPALLDKINVRIITPGATHGTAVNVFAGMERPERRQHAVATLLKLSGEKKVDPLSIKNVYLSVILKTLYDNGQLCTLQTLIDDIVDPPFDSLNRLPVDEAFPKRSRQALQLKINNILAAPSFEHWHKGRALDVEELYTNVDDKVNVTIYSVSHLTDEEQRMFALSYVLDEVLCWMRSQSGSQDLRALLVLDECRGLLPPHPANPLTKPPIMTMLTQARAFGLGLILSSQNPMDLDYKAMSNCETWLIGRLQMKQDRDRVLDSICSSNTVSRKALDDIISHLTPREFVAVRPGAFYKFVSRDCEAQLTGPLTAKELRELYEYINQKEEMVAE